MICLFPVDLTDSVNSCSISSFRPGARDPETDLQAQTGAEEAADASRGGAPAGGRTSGPALRPPVRGAPPAAGGGEGGAVPEREGARQAEVSIRGQRERYCDVHPFISEVKSVLEVKFTTLNMGLLPRMQLFALPQWNKQTLLM